MNYRDEKVNRQIALLLLEKYDRDKIEYIKATLEIDRLLLFRYKRDLSLSTEANEIILPWYYKQRLNEELKINLHALNTIMNTTILISKYEDKKISKVYLRKARKIYIWALKEVVKGHRWEDVYPKW